VDALKRKHWVKNTKIQRHKPPTHNQLYNLGSRGKADIANMHAAGQECTIVKGKSVFTGNGIAGKKDAKAQIKVPCSRVENPVRGAGEGG